MKNNNGKDNHNDECYMPTVSITLYSKCTSTKSGHSYGAWPWWHDMDTAIF